MNLKPVSEQTIVITGATSGIGLTTARMAAEEGAKLVLVARNEEALRELTNEINARGKRDESGEFTPTQAVFVAGDVADEETSRRAARAAMDSFGGFDTWVNDAGGSIFGRTMDVPTTDFRQLFETNVWGVVNGSRVAVEHLRGKGGALVNLGSEVSDATVPLQGIYSASKHAVKAFSEALRMELEADEIPVSVTIIKPTAIHTPFVENAKNYLPYEPQLPPPVYAPELVAEAILYCAENKMPEFYVGETAKIHSGMATYMPHTSEKLNEALINSAQNSGEPSPTNRADGLYRANSNLNERGAQDRSVIERSVIQKTQMHPLITGALFVGAGLGIAALIKSRGKSKNGGAETDGARNLESDSMSAQIREHTEVIGSDSAHVGSVDHVSGDSIKLRKRDANAAEQHHLIPLEWVETVDADGTVRLNKTANQAIEQWATDPKDEAAFKDSLRSMASGGGGAAGV